MKNTKELLGRRIRELRKALGMSQEQLSEKIDVDPRHISKIELGKSFPSVETLENISAALDVEIRDLFDYKHLSVDMDFEEEIRKLVEEGKDHQQKEMILRVVRAVIRSVVKGL